MVTTKLDSFTRAYIEAALWISTDDDGEPLDSNYGPEDLAPETLEKIIADCSKFQAECGHLLAEENCSYRGCPAIEYAGHDFWLTRGGHGCGFWDGDWADEVENTLTEAAERFGEVDLYVGDDGLIYC